jgi:hypothetical protein
MSILVNEPIKTIHCDRINDVASLIEKRAHLTQTVAATALPRSRVLSRRCSHDVECNLNGCRCRWSFLNSDYDPFAETASSET